jgi:hypothetical protein
VRRPPQPLEIAPNRSCHGHRSRTPGRGVAAGLLFALLALAPGCAASAPAPAPAQRFWANRYAWGTLGQHGFDARDLCGDAVPEELEVVATPTTVLLSIATIGVYTPQEVRVRCR